MECTYKVLIVRVCARMPSHFSRVRLSVTPWTVARQAPLSMGFSRQEYWSGLPLPSPVIKYEVSEVKPLSRVRLSATPWTMACQAPLSMGFSRQEYWSGLPFPSPLIKYEVSEVKSLSCVQLFATPWTVAYQAPPSMGLSRKSTGVGCHFLLLWRFHIMFHITFCQSIQLETTLA